MVTSSDSLVRPPPYPLFGNTSIFTSIVAVTLPVTATKNIHGCENHAIRLFYWTLKHPGWNDPFKNTFFPDWSK